MQITMKQKSASRESREQDRLDNNTSTKTDPPGRGSGEAISPPGKQGGLGGRRPPNSIPRQTQNSNFTKVNFVAGYRLVKAASYKLGLSRLRKRVTSNGVRWHAQSTAWKHSVLTCVALLRDSVEHAFDAAPE